jgi:hypothetical protein
MEVYLSDLNSLHTHFIVTLTLNTPFYSYTNSKHPNHKMIMLITSVWIPNFNLINRSLLFS